MGSFKNSEIEPSMNLEELNVGKIRKLLRDVSKEIWKNAKKNLVINKVVIWHGAQQ